MAFEDQSRSNYFPNGQAVKAIPQFNAGFSQETDSASATHRHFGQTM
jgi:hypothetical protein